MEIWHHHLLVYASKKDPLYRKLVRLTHSIAVLNLKKETEKKYKPKKHVKTNNKLPNLHR